MRPCPVEEVGPEVEVEVACEFDRPFRHSAIRHSVTGHLRRAVQDEGALREQAERECGHKSLEVRTQSLVVGTKKDDAACGLGCSHHWADLCCKARVCCEAARADLPRLMPLRTPRHDQRPIVPALAGKCFHGRSGGRTRALGHAGIAHLLKQAPRVALRDVGAFQAARLTCMSHIEPSRVVQRAYSVAVPILVQIIAKRAPLKTRELWFAGWMACNTSMPLLCWGRHIAMVRAPLGQNIVAALCWWVFDGAHRWHAQRNTSLSAARLARRA